MTYFADEASAKAALADPATGKADLMSVAYAYPSLGVDVARHPNAYPGLLDWLEQFGTPQARAEVAAVHAGTPAPVYRPARSEAPEEAVTPPPVAPPPVTPPPAPVAVPPAPVAVPPVAVPPVAVPPAPVTPTPAAAPAEEPAEYVSPFDEYSDEPEPEPRVAGAAAAADEDEDEDSEEHEGWSGGQKALVITLIAAIVVLGAAAAIIFGSVLPNHRALQAAQASYPTAVTNYASAQTALQTQIAAAAPLATVGPTDVKDPTTLTTLSSDLATAQSLIADPPEMGSTTSEINQQVSDLNNKTTAANNAAQALQSAIDGVQQSRVDLAVGTLQTMLSDAQGSYDSASYMGNTPARAQLEDMINQVTAATNNPSSLGSDTDSIVAALTAMGPRLQGYIDAVNAANKVVANKTLTYLLQGDQVTCGVNICYDGSGGGDPMSVVSVNVTVKGSTVTAKLCFMSIDTVDPKTCLAAGSTDPTWSVEWSGTRNGTTAKIISTSSDQAEFSWGTITFASSAPNAVATMFTAADNCEKSDGTGNGTLVNGSCQ